MTKVQVIQLVGGVALIILCDVVKHYANKTKGQK